MPKNYNNKKNFKPKNKGGDIVQEKWEGSTPDKPRIEPSSEYINFLAFRDLSKVGTIEVKADPNAVIDKSSTPYAIIARTNRVMNANYAGRDNINGNILTRLQNSTTSGFMNIFDVASINVRLNYLYMCYEKSTTTNHNNLAVNIEMLKAFNEAISHGYSTMLIQLPFFVDTYKSSMPVPQSISGTQDDAYLRMTALLHYQTVLQNAVSPLSKYIQLRSLEQEVLNMSYGREASTITSLYGLFKKAAFISTLNAIGSTLIGEYFDVDWYKQMNTLISIASRKSNSMVDPIMTCSATTIIPDAEFLAKGASKSYYNSKDTLKTADGIYFNPDTWTFEGTAQSLVSISFEDLIYRLNRMMDISTILTWARKLTTNPSTVGSITSPSAYYEQVNKLINQVNLIMTRFSANMGDIRTVLDKMSDSGMMYWKKGIKIVVDHIQQDPVSYNVLLDNLITNYIGGSKSMTYDQNTQRWQVYTMWNKYTGIAAFDQRSGGSALLNNHKKGVNYG